MPAARVGLIGMVIFVLFHVQAAASPIQVNVTGMIDGHMVNQSTTLSDPSQPLTVGSFSQHLTTTSGSDGLYQGGGTIDSSFMLWVSVGAPGSPSAGDSVMVTGSVHGSYAVSWPYLPNMSGSVSVSGEHAQLDLARGSSPADVPPYLADLLNHPERLGYGGSVGGGSQNFLQTTLTIAPPVDPNAMVPAPEPSMLAIALMTLAGLPIARRLGGRRPRAAL